MSKVKVLIGNSPPEKKSGRPSPIIIAGIALAALIGLITVAAMILPDKEESAVATDLPAHTVTKTPLGSTNRVQVDATDPALTRDDCVKLAVHYAPYAAGGGQVVVQKPNPNPPWNGKMLPFCVDNMEGGSVTFNDSYFP